MTDTTSAGTGGPSSRGRRPLEGMRVLDLSRFLAGPYCTLVLADLGAEVVKVERFPGGDDTRFMGPHVNGESYTFAMANRNKRSIGLNLKSERGIEVLRDLVREADVLVENFRPGVMDRLGVGPDALRELNPSLIFCSITGYGQDGPYRERGGFDIIAQGITGFMRMTGHPGQPPAKIGFAASDIAAGATAVYSILAAYVHQQATGEGQHLDISLLDSGLAWTMWEASAYFGAGRLPEPVGSRHRLATPYQAYRTQDGFVTIGADFRLWERACRDVFERPEWLEDPRFIDMEARLSNIDVLEEEIEAITTQQPTEYWVARLDAAGIPGGPVLRYDETLENEQVRARDMVVDVEHPVIGSMQMLGIPAKFSGTPLEIRSPAPLLGQHTREELVNAGYDQREIDGLVDEGAVFQAEGLA
jgi:crotonobetainyl-CoA:carnitine CoA-transferase CaiB-like acyl-CoA transferase